MITGTKDELRHNEILWYSYYLFEESFFSSLLLCVNNQIARLPNLQPGTTVSFVHGLTIIAIVQVVR